MDIEIKVTITAPDGTVHTEDIARFTKGVDTMGDIGLSIAESKELLLNVQQEIVTAQGAAFCTKRTHCPSCGRKLRCKARGQIRYRTVFGDVSVPSPRLYQCQCQDSSSRTFSPLTELLPEHVAPELLWLETKWASLASYGITADILKDVLPIDASLSPDTIRRHLGRVASRMEAELAEEQWSFIKTSPYQRTQLGSINARCEIGR